MEPGARPSDRDFVILARPSQDPPPEYAPSTRSELTEQGLAAIEQSTPETDGIAVPPVVVAAIALLGIGLALALAGWLLARGLP